MAAKTWKATDPGVELDNVEHRNARYPETFSIPPRDERLALRPKQEVKVIMPGNRVWLKVTERRDGDMGVTYVGKLMSHPVGYLCKAVKDDIVAFGPEHVLEIEDP